MSDVEFYDQTAPRVEPTSGKIYDITHADTNEHSVSLPTGYPANTKLLIISGQRMSGSGNLQLRSTSGVAESRWTVAPDREGVWPRAADGEFYYKLTAANDDWDIYVLAYITG